MRISILGLGWFGLPLAQQLKSKHQIMGSTRTVEKLSELTSLGFQVELLDESKNPSSELLDADVVVLNIPPFKEELQWFKSWPWNPKTHLIFISSTSIYGDQNGLVDEETMAQPQTENGKILLETESWVKSFPHYTIVRFAGLIGPKRHPGRILSGRVNLAGGNHPVNLIHLDDTVGFIELVIEKKISGETFNLSHPEHPSREDYYRSYCEEQGLVLPEFDQGPDAGKIISSRKVGAIYTFKSNIRSSF